MPQLDFYSYLTSVITFGIFFFLFFLIVNLLFLTLSFRQLATKAFFSIENVFQFIGGVAVLNGIFSCFVQKEQLVYRFNILLISNML